MVGSTLWFFRGRIYCTICYWRPTIRFLSWLADYQSKSTACNYGIHPIYANFFATRLNVSHGAHLELAGDRPCNLLDATDFLGNLGGIPCSYKAEQCFYAYRLRVNIGVCWCNVIVKADFLKNFPWVHYIVWVECCFDGTHELNFNNTFSKW